MHPSKSLTLGCLMLLAGNALGAASVDLSISATTHPAACDIRLDNGGKVDYGTLQHGDLNPDSSRETLLPYGSLPTRGVRVEIRPRARSSMITP